MSHVHRTAGCAVIAVSVLIGAARAQQNGQGAAGGGYRYYHNPMEQSLQSLRNEQIQQEIELDAGQRAALEKIRGDYYAKTQQIYKDLRSVNGSDRYEKLYEMRKKLSHEVETRVKKVLIPRQMDRLRQIMLQVALRYQGTSRTLQIDELAKELKITKQQQAQLAKAERKAREEMEAMARDFYKQLRAASVEKVLGVLEDQQRSKLNALMGDDFQLEPPSAPGGGRLTDTSGT